MFLTTSRRNLICLIFGFDFLHVGGKAILRHMDIEILFLAEGGNLSVPLHQHCQRGSLDAPDDEPSVVEGGEQPGAVDSHNPVRLGTGKRSCIQSVILLAVPQMGKAFTDGRIFKGADPETLERLGASGIVINQTEDQLALASCIGSADQLVDALVVHEAAQHTELFLFVLGDFIQPVLRHDGQIGVPPLGVAFIVGACIGKPYQMTYAPRNKIVISFEIAVPACGRAQHLGNGLGDARLLGDHKNQTCSSSFSASSSAMSGSSSSLIYGSSS